MYVNGVNVQPKIHIRAMEVQIGQPLKRVKFLKIIVIIILKDVGMIQVDGNFQTLIAGV